MSNMSDIEKMYTIKEVSETLQVTPRTVYSYIKDKKLKAVKIGKYWRVKRDELQSFTVKGTDNA
jgi:excisionase family DNA binding protein